MSHYLIVKIVLPVKTVKWDSNNLPIDIKAFNRGMELIKNCNVF